MIVKLPSDHARQLYENSIYSLVLKISIALKFIGQKLVELLNHPRKHLCEIMSINLSPPQSRKSMGHDPENFRLNYIKSHQTLITKPYQGNQ